MWQYMVKCLLLMLPPLIGTALVVFLCMHVIPGDIALLIMGRDQGGEINPHELAKLREQLGLNRPLYVQFFSWLWGIVHLHCSTVYGSPHVPHHGDVLVAAAGRGDAGADRGELTAAGVSLHHVRNR